MDLTDRFARLVARPPAEIRLDEAALVIAAHAYPDLDIGAQLGRLDQLAADCPAPTLDALTAHLFTDLHFTGNSSNYYDPRNSFLNDVMDRRTGIPISLAVLTMAVGRRLGVPLAGVGMPGHFLVRDRVDPDVFIDPFSRGLHLDRDGCERAFRSVHGADAPFDPRYLDPIDAPSILGRMLANLHAIHTAKRDHLALTWVLRLRLVLPGAAAEERAELASVLAARGRLSEAADELEQLADHLGGELGLEYRRSAQLLRARLN